MAEPKKPAAAKAASAKASGAAKAAPAKASAAKAAAKSPAPKTTAAKAARGRTGAAAASRFPGGETKPVATSRPAAVKRARPARARAATADAAAAAPAHSWRRSRRRTRVGLVSAAKQPHTVTVVVERMREHPLYKKVIRVRKKIAAHDAAGDVRAGDLVRIQESRPFSATKRWQVVEVLSRTGEAGAAAPRVADVEKLLEEAEGVTEILAPEAKPREEPGQPAEEGAE